MSIQPNLFRLNKELEGTNCKLIAVSKTYPTSTILEAYNLGQKVFGENKVQELVDKFEQLPKDIEWHMIGHLQSNKVKYIAPFIHLIHGVDSLKLIKEINKEGKKNNRTIQCLLQVHIAQEETKFGFSIEEVKELIEKKSLTEFSNIKFIGLMGMATNTDNEQQIKNEFDLLNNLFQYIKTNYNQDNINFTELSIGMSSDYPIAIKSGATLIRVGSAIFGSRNYN